MSTITRTQPFILVVLLLVGCGTDRTSPGTAGDNPFMSGHNEPIDYKNVVAKDLDEYTTVTIEHSSQALDEIRNVDAPSFERVLIRLDRTINDVNKAYYNCSMLNWLSPDSILRTQAVQGIAKLDSFRTSIYSDKGLYSVLTGFRDSAEGMALAGIQKALLHQFLQNFTQSGVNIEPDKQEQFMLLTSQINTLVTNYSANMNNEEVILVVDEEGIRGLSEDFKNTHRTSPSSYSIPVTASNLDPILNTASSEETRKGYWTKYYNRAAGKNVKVLDELVQKRYEMAKLAGFDSYGAYNLVPRMAQNPSRVWEFLATLNESVRPKALVENELLKRYRNKSTSTSSMAPINPWDLAYYKDQVLKEQFDVDREKVREYFPMNQCIDGMMRIYQTLLGFEFRKIENPSVWHESVELYEVYEGSTLRGRFYLDLYPRANKESWFYGMVLADGTDTPAGYEIPLAYLLGNFPKQTDSRPSLLSHFELTILFHEFGHIMEKMSYQGPYCALADTKLDFGEAMSQLFENWIWDYDIVRTFATHYRTKAVLPEEEFEKMKKAKTAFSGLKTTNTIRLSMYDLSLYDKYDPLAPFSTDDLWKRIEDQMRIEPLYVEGTHQQASWTHINGFPVYMYGYLWSNVYAQDMFSVFEKNGLMDRSTGLRYRQLILANGGQRPIPEAIEEFLGRPSDNRAFAKSLGIGSN